MTKPCRVVRKPVRDRLVVRYPSYFADGQTVGVLGRYRSAQLKMAMVHIVARMGGREVEVALPADKFVTVEQAAAEKAEKKAEAA